MSIIKWVPDRVPDRNALGGRTYAHRKTERGVLGQVIASQQIIVTPDDVSIIEETKRQACVVDYLAIVGGVAIVFFGVWIIFQGVRGVLKSEIYSGDVVVGCVGGSWVDGAG